MRWSGVVYALIFGSVALAQSPDPFVGTWVYNAEKSPKPSITYSVRDLGGDRYALTGSTGETTEINADGKPIKSPSGATVSFKKMDDHRWHMDRVDSRTMARTYTVSADDNTLTLVDVFTGVDGSEDETTTRYARSTPGKSIFGDWKSTSMEEKSDGAEKFIIKSYGRNGLSLTYSVNNHRVDMNFDGKQYLDQGPDRAAAQSTSGTRVDAHFIKLEGQIRGKSDESEELKVSADGKTLTMVSRSIKSGAAFTSVWDRLQ